MNAARRFRMLVAGALCATLGAGILVSAAGAGQVEPAGGSGFDTGADGWTSPVSDCALLGAGGLFCDATGERVGDGGKPGGALRARTSALVNALGIVQSNIVLRSPTFSYKAAPTDAAFSYDRRFATGGINLGLSSEVSVVLVNETAATDTVLLMDPLSSKNGSFGTRLVGVPRDTIASNTPYHLEIRVLTGSTSTPEEAFGSADAIFDNIRLVSSDRSDGGDGGGGGGIAPGGSVTRLSECTILGTQGDDRIKGTQRADIICALGGDDVVKGLGGRDVIDLAGGNDRANGNKKADLLLGLAGRDKLVGATGGDKLSGGKDADVLRGGADNDNLSARDGVRDLVDGGPGKRNRARIDSKDKVKRVQRVFRR